LFSAFHGFQTCITILQHINPVILSDSLISSFFVPILVVSTESVKGYAGENTVPGIVSLVGQTETEVVNIQKYSGSSGWGSYG
jgi:hypothetical protein